MAAFEEAGSAGDRPPDSPSATPRGEPWAAPAPALTIPLPILTDAVEVLVYNHEAGPTLAGAIELVSPSNKDRPAHREAFVAKGVAYLQRGVGLTVVDIVTDRRADLHAELLARLGSPVADALAPELYAASYRPVRRDDRPSLDIWREPLALGHPLPTMPLWLPGGLGLPVDLDTTYDRTRRELRIDRGYQGAGG